MMKRRSLLSFSTSMLVLLVMVKALVAQMPVVVSNGHELSKTTESKSSQKSCFSIVNFNPVNEMIWTGIIDSNWNNTENWDGLRLPVLDDNVTIPQGLTNYPTINIANGGDCNNLIVEPGASLVVASGGSLITQGDIFNYGIIDIKRTIPGNEWHMIAVPNSTTTAAIFMGNYLNYFDESTAYWIEILDISTELIPGRGYALWGTNDTATYSFTGIPNTGNQNHAFTAENQYGLNLLGNPYPSSLDWDLVIADQQNINGAVYCFDPTMGNRGQHVAYVAGLGDCRYIPPQQGFFINAVNSGTFNLLNEHRVHINSSNFYKNRELPDNYLELNVYENEQLMDKLYFRFNPDATEYFDGDYDAYKIPSYPEFEFYTVSLDDKLSIDQQPECEEVQLGFYSEDAGYYNIVLNEVTDFTEVLIYDTKTGYYHNLAVNDYEFMWETNDDETRFKLLLKTLESNFTSTYSVICENDSVTFFPDTLAVMPDSVFWSFPGGYPDFSTEMHPLVEYPEQGVFEVSLTVFWQGNSATNSKPEYMLVNAIPEAPAKPFGVETVCYNQYSSVYTTNSQDVIWELSPPASGTINYYDSACQIIWDQNFSGEVSLKVKIYNGCGEGEFSEHLYIQKLEPSNAEFSASQTVFVTQPYTVQFTNLTPNPDNFGFFWDFGNGGTSTEVQPEYTYPENGEYSVILKATNITTACTDSLLMENYIFCSGVGIGAEMMSGFGYSVDQTEKILFLKFIETPENKSFRLYNQLGNLQKALILSQDNQSISLSNLTAGIYFFVIDNKISGKFILAR
ncbi:MAG: hypothetical protein B6D61_12655 [Bacteroidetes bacterium 4484_249]|nr:MAG: hypothetical protein B6D61_12655 [Bacteroidetes bacterium 4484_249]